MADDDGRGPEAALERSLTRMRAALAAGTDGGMVPLPPVSRLPPEGRLGGLLLALAGSSLLLLAGTGAWPFLGLAVAFGVSGGLFFARGLTQRHLARSRGPAYIGMGASVSSSAVVEPGAVVEMGATVGEGATVRSGALVGMGATVGAHAVLESGAVVSWGATVRREQALRTEVDLVALGRLDDEKRELEGRLATATDESLRRSLVGAVAAIEEQRRQRELLRLSADRLQAEHMRLVYTLEGLASQFVRLRTAGAEAGRVSAAGLEQGVRDLGAELDAIADALEQESQNLPASTPRVRG